MSWFDDRKKLTQIQVPLTQQRTTLDNIAHTWAQSKPVVDGIVQPPSQSPKKKPFFARRQNEKDYLAATQGVLKSEGYAPRNYPNLDYYSTFTTTGLANYWKSVADDAHKSVTGSQSTFIDTVGLKLMEKGFNKWQRDDEEYNYYKGVTGWFSNNAPVKLPKRALKAATFLEKQFPASQGWKIRSDETVSHGKQGTYIDIIAENKRLNQASVISLNPYSSPSIRNYTDIQGGMAAHLYRLSHPGVNVSSHVLSLGKNEFPNFHLTADRTPDIQKMFYPRLNKFGPTQLEAHEAIRQNKNAISSGLPVWKGGTFNGKTFTALDIETGGWIKKPVGNWPLLNKDVLSLSAIRFGQDETTGQWYELGRFNRFYNPQDTSSPDWHQSREIHHLSSSKLTALRKAYGMPTLVTSYTQSEAKRLGRFIGNSTVVTHNGAQFDIPILQRWGNSLIQGSGHIDTMIASQNWKDSGGLEVFEKIGLADVYKQIFNKEMPDHHFAEADTVATLQVAVNMMGKNNPTASAMRYIASHNNLGLIKTEFGTDQVVRGWGVGGANINGQIPYQPGDIIEASKYLEEVAEMAKKEEQYGMAIGAQLRGKGQGVPISPIIEQLPNQKTEEEMALEVVAAAASSGVPISVDDASGMQIVKGGDYSPKADLSHPLAETQSWLINSINSLATLFQEDIGPSLRQAGAANRIAAFKGAAKYDMFGSEEEQRQAIRKLQERGIAYGAEGWKDLDMQTRKTYQMFRDDYLYDQAVLEQKQEEKDRTKQFIENAAFEDSRERMREYVEDAYFGDKLHKDQYEKLMEGIDVIRDKDGIHDMYRQIHRDEIINRAMDKQDAEEDRARAKKYGWNKSLSDSLGSVATKGEDAASTLEKVSKALGSIGGYNYERINKAFSSQLGDIHSSLGGLIPSGFQKPVSHLFAATQNAWNRYWAPRHEAIQRTQAFKGLVEMIPGGKLLTGAANLISSIHGPSLEKQIVEKGQMWSQTFNLLSAGASLIGPVVGLIKDLIMAPIKLLGSALKMFAGLIGGITGIMLKGMKSYNIPTTGLSGVTTSSLAGWEAADTAFGLGKGTLNNMVNDFGQQRTMLYTTGKFNQDRLVASAMLGVFSSVYNSTGTAEENFESTTNELVRQYRGAKTDRERERIMALAGQIDSNLPNMIETMSVLGMRSVSQYKDPGQFGVYWNPRGSSQWDRIARERGFSSESQRLRKDYYEFDNSRVQFQMSMSRISAWMWETFGRGIFSSLNQALDQAAQGNFQGLLDWAADLIGKIGTFLKQALEKVNVKDWLHTLLSKLKEAIAFVGNIEIDGVSLKDRIINLFETIAQAIFDIMNDLISTLNSMEIHPEALLPGHEGEDLISFASSKNRLGGEQFLQQMWRDNEQVGWIQDHLSFNRNDIDKSNISSADDLYKAIVSNGATGYFHIDDGEGGTIKVPIPTDKGAINDMLLGMYQNWKQPKFHRGLLGKEWYKKKYVDLNKYREMQLVHFDDVTDFGKDRIHDIADEAAGSAAVAKAAGANVWNSLITGNNNATLTIKAQGENGTTEKIAEVTSRGVTMTNKQILLDGKWMFITAQGNLIPQAGGM